MPADQESRETSTWALQRVTHVDHNVRYTVSATTCSCRSQQTALFLGQARQDIFHSQSHTVPQYSSTAHSCISSPFQFRSTKTSKYSICKCSDHPTVNVRESRRGRLVGKSVHLFSRKPGTEEDPLCLSTKITLSKPP
jgi:hypothetical protein